MKSAILSIKGALALIVFLSVVGVISCKKDRFLLPDRNSMDAGIWDNEGGAQFYINGLYNLIMPEWPFETAVYNIMHLSDESIISATDGTLKKGFSITAELRNEDYKFIGNKYQGSSKGDNKYFEIGRCNVALNRLYNSTLPLTAKKKFLGQLYVLRAIAYFDLVRIWGGVPLMLKEQDPENLDIKGRSKASEVLAQIVTDLDSAAVNLDGIVWNENTEYGKFTKLAAVCYKARVLMYAASPLFNPLNDPEHPYDQTKWDKALLASKEAYDLCLASGVSLMSDYSAIFRTEGKANTEAIMIRGYSKDLEKRFQNVEKRSRPGGALTGGSPSDCYIATSKLLDSYTMDDGTPISQSNTYDPVLYWKNRDPRFYATIAYNGSDWKLSGIADRKQWNYVAEVDGGSKPFYCKRFTDPNLPAGSVGDSNDKGGNGFDWIELRFAEVLLNYAECLNETGNISGAKDQVRKLKIRAGVKPGTKDYGLALATTKEGMRDLLLNERQIEFAFEGKRGMDLRRTRKMHLLTGFLSTQLESTKTPALKLQLEEIDPKTNRRRRDTLNTNLRSTYLYFFQRNIIYGNVTNAIAFPEKNYFIGLPNTFLNSSPLLEQTKGWGGSFDPL